MELGEVERAIMRALSPATNEMTTTTTTTTTFAEEGDKLLLQDENNTLRTKCRDLEEAYSQLRARCFALEATSRSGGSNNYNYCQDDDVDLLRCRSSATNYTACMSNQRGKSNNVSKKENQDLISSLFERNDSLMRDYSALRSRHQNVLSNNAKLKKENQTLRLRTSGTHSRPRTSIFPTSSSFAAAKNKRTIDNSCYEPSRNDTDALIEALQTRLDQAEKQVELFKKDPPTKASVNYTGTDSDVERKSHESLIKELADATTSLHSLKEKYGQLETTCNECLDTLERTKAELRTTKREKLRAVEEVVELQRQNASLEEKITSLCCCDDPFTTSKSSSQKYDVSDPTPSKKDEANKSSVEIDVELDEYADDDFEESIDNSHPL